MVTGPETVPSAATLNRIRSEVCGNHNVLPSADHRGPSAATVPSPMILSPPAPVPICWTIAPVVGLKVGRKRVKSFQVRAARYWPLGLIDDDRRRPLSTSSRLPIGLIRWLVGSRVPSGLLGPTWQTGKEPRRG